ncbi:7 transmembrane sweet-taste receptor of 3 GCPR-domain-containing protein [Chytridium lagenaria]|nr:7 transmembrane sweet-taste receptor of 3 GCPR-domain-containing protein [Chytridium lagenaria]
MRKLMAEKNQTLRALDGDLRFPSDIRIRSMCREKMQLIPSVMIVPSADGGGNPYDSFSYLVTDGLRKLPHCDYTISRNWAWVLPQPNPTQMPPLAPGFYSTTFSYSSSCTPCPAGTSQSRAGSSQCVPCERAIFLSLTNATNTNSTSLNLPSTIVGIDDVASFGTFQDTAGQATCMSCMMLQYAIRVNSTSCEGRAFIPKYAYPSVSGMLLGGSAFIAGIGNSNGTLVRSVLDASSRSSDVVSAIDQARIMNAPRAVVVTGCLIAIITFLGLIGTFLFSNDPVIKASSPIALTITAVGIIMGALSVITYSVEPSKASCVAEVWLLPISFSVTFRILRIFNNPRALKIRMTNVDLFGYMVAATSANVAILIIWTIYDPPVPVVFPAVLYLYNAGLLVILSILAFLTRSVNALFSESKFIGYFVAATVFSVSLFIPILYFLTNEISGIYIIKSVAILIITSSAFATLIGIKFYSIFRNRQQQASGFPRVPTRPCWVNGKVGINSLYMQLLQTSPTTMVANTVFPTKKVGVVFWNAKVAILQPELRMLFILSPDVAASAKAPAPIPEMIVLPLTKFTVSSPESSSNSTNKNFVSTMGTSSVMDSSASSGSSNPTTTSPILTVTNNESGHVVTLQFESSQIKREWMMVLNQLAEGKHVRVEHEKKAVVATGKGDA